MRNIDILRNSDYEREQNKAAVKAVEAIGYGGSVEALALKQAFIMGSNTATSAPIEAVARAFAEGRSWAVSETAVLLPVKL